MRASAAIVAVASSNRPQNRDERDRQAPVSSVSLSLSFASVAAILSGVVAAIGVVFLILMYIGFVTPARGLIAFGPLNDFCILVQYALALPVIGAFDRLLAPIDPVRRRLIASVGMTGCLGAVIFQALLLLDLMSSREQVGYATASVILAGLWAALAGHAARSIGALKVSTGLLVGAGLYFGYPLWALMVGRELRLARGQPAQTGVNA